ncbi:MAG: glutamine--tRNA ligase/YqeY domain fusion protein [Gemmatimonadales bacterium]|uniref:glutamine--tRNA ligase/YqeY domain fusion protein n=1 Tax=Candidatus Palauibacter irciniicola TaxID=3056733 RepID=UPI00137FE81D|nr:glutamine--tRNA ligase/YqeY domain fusion protein [Candidatus Palauibacter irciniicola]MYC18718.1 glutamine--tRNA ligase/YqeY domain fusion protein [Gemmatimonadales bacterium]
MPQRERLDFIRQIVAEDVLSGRHGGRVLTRFPPEPNGFLHVGHASAICLDFEVAREYGGRTTLRMDDTNPTTEDPSYVEAIARDIRWLGFEWDGEIRYASDYFGALYRMALRMIEDGFAYVDSLSEEEIRAHRGSVREPSRPSPYRDRSTEENLDLFRRMRAGEFDDGKHVLRARIDLAASNMKLRDPLMYRIRHAHHYRTGDEWPIYPFYDWAHGQSDAIEGITHSFCTLEFQDNRALYDWFIEHTRPSSARIDRVPEAEGGGGEALGSWDPRPRQYEFARRNLDYTIVSKRKLLLLVEDGHVSGWDDPRMPTLAGFRRRGIPPDAIRAFCRQVGIGKADNRVEIATLEWAVREALNQRAPRVLAVLRPLEVVVENCPEGEVDWIDAPYFPRGADAPPEGWPETRKVPFTRVLYIERDDFAEEPAPGFRRLAPGREVRLRHGYFITCRGVEKDDAGRVVRLRCTYDPETRSGSAPDGRTPAGTIHWVSATESVPMDVRLYDRLFRVSDPAGDAEGLRESLNPDSLEVLTDARGEPSLAEDPPETAYQFERLGYFVPDRATRAGTAEADGGGEAPDGGPLVFNRTVTLRDAWSRRAKSDAARDADSPETRARAADESSGPAVPGIDSAREARDAARRADPALQAAFDRFRDPLGLPDELADLLSGSTESVRYYERAIRGGVDPAAVATWLVHEVRGAGGSEGDAGALEPEALAELVELVLERSISRAVAKSLLARLVEDGGSPREIVRREGLGRIGDAEQIREVVQGVVAAHPAEVARYAAGHTGLAGFFVGQVMRATHGRADPAIVRELLEESLNDAT